MRQRETATMPALAVLLLTVIFTKVVLADSPCPKPPAPKTPTNLVLDVMVVLDKKAIDKWQKFAGSREKLEEEIRSIYFEMNEIYKSLQDTDPALNIEIRLYSIMYLEDPQDQIVGQKELLGNDQTVNVSLILESLAKFVDRKGWVDLPWDHLQWITGYDVKGDTSGNQDTGGVAYLGKMCTHRSLSVIETFLTIMSAVHGGHEIGHSLGSNHDGDTQIDDPNNCDPTVEMLMSPAKQPSSTKKWFFSNCSAKYIKKVVDSLQCLCLHPDNSETPPIVALRYGELVGANEICKRYDLPTAMIQYEPSMYSSDEFCTYVTCLKSWSGNSRRYGFITEYQESSEGMPCGLSKRCYKGKCTDVPQATPWTSETCPLGEETDLPANIFGVDNCKAFARSGKCPMYGDAAKRMCCQQCA